MTDSRRRTKYGNMIFLYKTFFSVRFARADPTIYVMVWERRPGSWTLPLHAQGTALPKSEDVNEAIKVHVAEACREKVHWPRPLYISPSCVWYQTSLGTSMAAHEAKHSLISSSNILKASEATLRGVSLTIWILKTPPDICRNVFMQSTRPDSSYTYSAHLPQDKLA